MIDAEADSIYEVKLFRLIDLLVEMLQASDVITVIGVKRGSTIVSLELSELDALNLVAIFPEFHDYAMYVIEANIDRCRYRNIHPEFNQSLQPGIYKRSDGTYYSRLREFNETAMSAHRLSDFLFWARKVKELRIPVALVTYGEVPKGDMPDEQEIDADIMAMTGFIAGGVIPT